MDKVTFFSNLPNSWLPNYDQRFGASVGIDIGASKAQGTIRGYAASDDGEHQVAIKGYDGQVSRHLLHSPTQFVEKVSEHIVEALKRLSIKSNRAQEYIQRLVIMIPGLNDRTTAEPANIMRSDGKKIGLIDFGNIKSYLQNAGIQVAKKFNFSLLIDTHGSAAVVARKLIQEGRLLPGRRALLIMTGGGLGSVEIDHQKDNILLRVFRGASTPMQNQQAIIEEFGASAPSLRRNFAEALGVKGTQLTQFIQEGNTEAVTNFTKAKKIMQPLLKKPLTEDEYLKAAKAALTAYLDSLGYLIAISARDPSLQTVVLNGKVAEGMEAFIEKYPELYEEEMKSLLKWPPSVSALAERQNKLMKKVLIKKVLDHEVGISRKKLLDDITREKPGFQIISDIDVSENTEGIPWLLEGEAIDPDHPFWFQIPLKKMNV
ncbi:MAG: hypothetical protein KTR14_04205 [Vampirovibrio sp.]|nr:hypothetical protein [Vampirovibrio sp.]